MMKVFGSDFEAFKRPFDFDSALAFFKMLYEEAEEMDNPGCHRQLGRGAKLC